MRTQLSLRLASVFVAVLLLAAGVGPASAAFLAFIEQGDVVTVVNDPNFECGIQSTVDGENAHVVACWYTLSPVGYAGAGDAYMVEPVPIPGATYPISDRIHIQFSVGPGPGYNIAQATIDFVSDPDGAPPAFPPPGVPVVVEDGTSQPLNDFFVDTAGNRILPPANIELRAQSDVEPVPTNQSTWGRVKGLYH